MHIQRLRRHLDSTDLDYVIYNTLSGSEDPPRVVSPELTRRGRAFYVPWFIGLAIRDRARILHMNSMNSLAQLLLAVLGPRKRRKVVLTIHSAATEVALGGSRWRRRLTAWMLRRLDVVVASNPATASDLLNIAGLPPEKVRVIPSFIPPTPIDGELPQDLDRFFANHDPVITAVGWIGHEFEGEDLYGLDLLLAAVNRLRRDFPQLGAIFCINGGDPARIDAAVATTQAATDGHVLPVTGLENVIPVFRRADVFVRPTNTDGDALSVREALHVGTPVVASDAIPRPAAATLFRNRNLDDFVASLRRVLSDLDSARSAVAHKVEKANAATVLEALYRELLGR